METGKWRSRCSGDAIHGIEELMRRRMKIYQDWALGFIRRRKARRIIRMINRKIRQLYARGQLR